MTHTPTTLAAALALLLALAAVPARAASSVSSEALGSVSTSFGSSSTSLETSSNSSTTKKTDKVADGRYTIVAMAAVAGQPGSVRLQLQALDDSSAEGALALVLPQATADRSGLGAGQVVAAQHRPYGLQFARGDTGQAFFLVLDDDWSRELQTRPLSLAPSLPLSLSPSPSSSSSSLSL